MTTLKEGIDTVQASIENLRKTLPEGYYLCVDANYAGITFGSGGEYFAKYTLSCATLYCFHKSPNVLKIHEAIKQYIDPECRLCVWLYNEVV